MYGHWMDKICLNVTEEEINNYLKKQKQNKIASKESKLSIKDRFVFWLLEL